MRSVDERCAAVRNRARRLRRRRHDGVLVVLICLMALPLVDLAGRTASGGAISLAASGEALFGAASLFGASVGGYVLVAVAGAVVAVLVMVFFKSRKTISRGSPEDEDRRRSEDSMREGESMPRGRRDQ